jgi:cell division septation protein DedD
MCAIDHTPFETPSEPPPPPPPELKRPEYDFAPLSEGDRQKDLVTLVACRTLGEADMVVSRLRAAGIEAFLPDESLMQVIAWNLNTYGYVRVQIAPKDYDAARDLLAEN